MAETATLICPKCRGQMRTYERNGILVDQCEECRGIFLDRGELERLIEIEGSHGGDESSSDRHHEHDWDEHEDGHEHRREKKRTSRTSFIADLLGGGE